MNPEQFDDLVIVIFFIVVMFAFAMHGTLSTHRRKQEKAAREIALQLAAYLLASLKSPEDVTVDHADEFEDRETYKKYQKLHLEASKLSALQDLTGDNIKEVIEAVERTAEDLRPRGGGVAS